MVKPVELCDSAVSGLARGPRRDLLSQVLLWLLDHQWIESKLHRGRYFKVRRGSGMVLFTAVLCAMRRCFFWLKRRGQGIKKFRQHMPFKRTFVSNMTSGYWQAIEAWRDNSSVDSGPLLRGFLKANWWSAVKRALR